MQGGNETVKVCYRNGDWYEGKKFAKSGKDVVVLTLLDGSVESFDTKDVTDVYVSEYDPG